MRLIVAVLLMTLPASVWADELRGSVLAGVRLN
jgi:hypothetical protein